MYFEGLVFFGGLFFLVDLVGLVFLDVLDILDILDILEVWLDVLGVI